jgi:hypothetical protein
VCGCSCGAAAYGTGEGLAAAPQLLSIGALRAEAHLWWSQVKLTLIINELNHQVALQCSDRLLTRGSVEFDKASNKTVIFEANDGIAVLSYSGRAFLGTLQTDTWIAETLSERSLGPLAAGEAMDLLISNPTSRFRLGPSLRRLANKLSEAARAETGDSRRNTNVISIVGWQLYRRKRPQGFYADIEESSSGLCHLRYAPRYRDRKQRIFARPKGHVQLRDLAARRAQWTAPLLSQRVDAYADLFAHVSSREPRVGRDCMVVAVHNPAMAGFKARVTFRDGPTGTAAGDSPPRVRTHTPWIVSAYSITSPSIITGGQGVEFGIGRYRIWVDAAPNAHVPNPGEPNFSSFPQRRPSRP